MAADSCSEGFIWQTTALEAEARTARACAALAGTARALRAELPRLTRDTTALLADIIEAAIIRGEGGCRG